MAEPAHFIRTIETTVAQLRDQHPSSAGRGWDFDGFRVWVDSNAPALLAELRRFYRASPEKKLRAA